MFLDAETLVDMYDGNTSVFDEMVVVLLMLELIHWMNAYHVRLCHVRSKHVCV